MFWTVEDFPQFAAALANILGCWSYLQLLEAIDEGTTHSYVAEVDANGGFIRCVLTSLSKVGAAEGALTTAA